MSSAVPNHMDPTSTTLEAGKQNVPIWQLSTAAICACAVLAAAMIGSQVPAWSWMYNVWMTYPDNSHGLLVPAFAVVLLWLRRSKCPPTETRVSKWVFGSGIFLIVLATAVNCAGIYTRTRSIEAISIILYVAGVVVCWGGWPAIRWAWPSVLFLLFMVPLPRVIGQQLGGALQRIATIGSTLFLQLSGVPAVAEGNIIFLSSHELGVAEACSGIRMLMCFFALTTAMCFLSDRPIWERCVVFLSAPIIAIASNILRIFCTGIAFEFGDEKLAEMVFHDLAGWLMMPVGLVLLWAELWVLSKIFPIAEEETVTVDHNLRKSR